MNSLVTSGKGLLLKDGSVVRAIAGINLRCGKKRDPDAIAFWLLQPAS